MRKAMFVSMLVGLTTTSSAGQPPRQPDAARLARHIEKLGVTARVLYIAAHPDDENTKLLAWLANEQRVRTAYLSITRGDGGQNLLGSDQGVDLGIIRTQELLAARRIDGAEQLFTTARDFGFSKSPEEALAVWGKDEILADVVWAIRKFQPHVVITRFPTSGMDTHGHHTASAILAGQAYKLAADPSYRPEQVAKVGVWQARRLLQNVPSFSGPVVAKPGDVVIDVGGYDAALGLSYGELAADSRSMHKSQGFGVARSREPSPETLRLLDGAPMTTSIFDGVDLDWTHVTGAAQLASLLARAKKTYDWRSPEKVLPLLAQAHAQLLRLPKTVGDQAWITAKRDELVEVMLACAGVSIEAIADRFQAVPGSRLDVKATLLNRTAAKVELVGPTGPIVLAKLKAYTEARGIVIAREAAVDNPYWLESPPLPGRFVVRDPDLVGLAERPSPLALTFDLSVAGERVSVRRTVFYKWVDPVAGERHRNVEITPRVTVTPVESSLLFVDDRPHELRVRVSSVSPIHCEVRLELPAGFLATPDRLPIAHEASGAETELKFQVRPAKGAQQGTLRIVVLDGDVPLSHALSRIEYAHIPIQTRFPTAEVKLTRFPLVHARSRIGYVAGAGDEVPTALRQVGYEVTSLDDEQLQHGDLARYEAIVTGVRAFNVNARLPFLHRRLMEYVSAGGTLLVQYNTNNRLSKVPTELGPYPFTIAQDRVTDESAVIGQAAHPVLERPNRITSADFAGWVQERGLYFAGTWDSRYETPLTMNDANEAPKQGSLLVARHGKGAFVYTGLSFFRQLPAGVPGAFRLFANLIDLGK